MIIGSVAGLQSKCKQKLGMIFVIVFTADETDTRSDVLMMDRWRSSEVELAAFTCYAGIKTVC